jgi:hypothetical protein
MCITARNADQAVIAVIGINGKNGLRIKSKERSPSVTIVVIVRVGKDHAKVNPPSVA